MKLTIIVPKTTENICNCKINADIEIDGELIGPDNLMVLPATIFGELPEESAKYFRVNLNPILIDKLLKLGYPKYKIDDIKIEKIKKGQEELRRDFNL